MTRIIAGFAGSLGLTVPASGTRPTSDRVREALFSALEARGLIRGGAVLDLYAGSGALGLEAASRGARRVTLVDRAPAAVRACRRNTALVRQAAARQGVIAAEVEIRESSAAAFLRRDPPAGPVWDLVFLDPPYACGAREVGDVLRLLPARLTAGALVLLERSARDAPPPGSTGLDTVRRTAYGDTVVWWLGAAPAGSPRPEAA